MPKTPNARPFRAPSRFGRRYDWRPDLPDHRDLLFAATIKKPQRTPACVDLREKCSPVFDQGKIGSCTGNALAGALEFLELQEAAAKGGPQVYSLSKFAHVSRLFIYFNERAIEGTTDQDGGAALRDGIKSLAEWGACRETLWKYSSAQLFKKPDAKAYAEGEEHKISSYLRIESQNLDQIRQCLVSGYPFVLGFSVFEGFESEKVARTGELELPGPDERMLGGHAVLAVGYDDRAGRLIVRNSWGENWGDRGYFTMPYAYATEARLARDFWTIRR